MCGIVGYVGYKPVVDILLDGLEQLEYRGYDSSGIAVKCTDSIKVYKAEGKLVNLREELAPHAYEISKATLGIGHIRWATHGAPTVVNAHPHTCGCGKLVVVHNGIIENYKELKAELEAKGCQFRSQTDTETVAHLIAMIYGEVKDLTKAVQLATKKIEGAYALGIMHNDEPNKLVVTKRNAPLIIGVGENEYYAASDVPAIIKHTNKAIYLKDNQVATLTPSSLKLEDEFGNEVIPKVEVLPWEPVALSKMGYKHFMLKEIHEQPDVIRNILIGKLHTSDSPIVLNEVKLTKEHLRKLNRIQIIACGTSLHAAMVGKYIIEAFCGIPVDVEPSSEYIYRKTVTDEHTLVIGVSQSGETADTLTAIKQAKAKGSHVLIITNRPDSAMAREADSLIPVSAGIEVSVAATKSYIAQLTSFYLLALYMAETKESLPEVELNEIKSEMLILPQKIEQILAHKENIQACARKYASTRDFIYIARGINYPTALEGALKLKEISYINATGYPAGELKHGPIAMLDETMPVLSILMQGKVFEKLLSNSEEAKARNARMVALTNSSDPKLEDLFDFIIKVPEVHEYLSPIVATIPLQLIAYYIAEFLGKDVDQPRNLAKSVTVE
ncbi:TPA: glutamine--fructose-6-phosphate transaminase (isomerizing) [Candidatus Gastranaerophilales bacterium HUM_6]|nr:glucosamine--fructose-6-phosphate aminotransferase [isomerizing] [Fusobacterium sp. CAG:815]DAA89793.1 MAG TPA: glutamine--fructose-6-phosphate transaminase (isomerizing) [Candidatus Gastranaerophilales bacterium HUM_6]DAA91540.1 MAG TPA: glutamine--fructose-6-phosphate transaminase (isomerizing) [Candidatus Gastranaerophilales bacterium HUM_7]DAB01515.1 MAG TPA: glutamine--fructose-6-phosphate transaminase (isomerizing) [Candidatus Gastranaerophilales bacterium HUM_12]DAB05140.1 MAG TPA: gl